MRNGMEQGQPFTIKHQRERTIRCPRFQSLRMRRCSTASRSCELDAAVSSKRRRHRMASAVGASVWTGWPTLRAVRARANARAFILRP